IRDRNVTGVQTCALPIWLSQIDETWTEQQLHDFPLSIVEHKQVAQFRDEQTLAERELIRLHDTFARLSEQEKANRKERDTLRDEIGRAACRERVERSVRE